MPLDFKSADPPVGRGSPVVVTTKFLRDGRYIITGIDSWVICLLAKGHPPPAVTPKFKIDDRYIVMGINFMPLDKNVMKIFYVSKCLYVT